MTNSARPSGGRGRSGGLAAAAAAAAAAEPGAEPPRAGDARRRSPVLRPQQPLISAVERAALLSRPDAAPRASALARGDQGYGSACG